MSQLALGNKTEEVAEPPGTIRTRFQSISVSPGIPVPYNGEVVRVVVVVLSVPIITALECPPS